MQIREEAFGLGERENQYFLILKLWYSSIDFHLLSLMYFNIKNFVILLKRAKENILFESMWNWNYTKLRDTQIYLTPAESTIVNIISKARLYLTFYKSITLILIKTRGFQIPDSRCFCSFLNFVGVIGYLPPPLYNLLSILYAIFTYRIILKLLLFRFKIFNLIGDNN